MHKILFAVSLMLGFCAGNASSAILLYDRIESIDHDRCERPGLPPDETISWCASLIRMHIYTGDDIHFAQLLLHMGLAYRLKGQEDAAIDSFNLALQVVSERLANHPDNPALLRERCWIRTVFNFGLDVARIDCEHGLQIDPKNAELLGSMGFLLYRQGNYPEALSSYDAALGIKDDDANSLFMRGIVKQKLGDDHGSALDIKAATDRDLRIPLAYKSYGVIPH